VKPIKKGDQMQKQSARARTNASPRQPRRGIDARAQQQRDVPSVPREQALAVWRLERASRANPLPCELARAAILHYTDPGDLVLAPKLRGGELLHTAAALGRRALPLAANTHTGVAATSVVPLRPRADAALVLAPLGARASERRLQHVAARLLPLLRPGGFLALARGTRATDGGALGEVVRACHERGLEYWQHVVALTPALAVRDDSGACAGRTCRQSERDGRAARCHHDLLVFRRAAHATTECPAAAVEAVAA
jgi:hypothetical protein